jgi:WD40 repeat protein
MSAETEEVPTGKNRYDIEKIARILSLVAIPFVLAASGWVIQNRLTERNLSQEYVKLAVSILEKPKSSEVPAGLRDWAVDLLNQNSSTKFSAETIRQLKAGEINLAGVLSSLVATANNGGGIAISPDEKTIATGQDDGRVAIWDVASGRQVSRLVGHSAPVTAVVYAPDAKTLFSGSLDNTVIAWDIVKGEMLSRFAGLSSVVGLAVSPDGRVLAVRSADREVQMWDLSSGKPLNKLRLEAPRP